MKPHLRKLALTAHVMLSVGWLGAVLAYLPLAISGLSNQDAQTVRAAYLAMEMIGWYVIVPSSLAALTTGLVQSLGTSWGLFRHYWIVAKLLLTVGATIILLKHMSAVSRMSRLAAQTMPSIGDSEQQRIQLVVHAAGGIVVLLVVTTLSVFKPWGLTRYGRRKQQERRMTPQPRSDVSDVDDSAKPAREAVSRTSWRQYMWLGILGLLVLIVVWHVVGGSGSGSR